MHKIPRSFGAIIKPFKSLLKAFKKQSQLNHTNHGVRPKAAPPSLLCFNPLWLSKALTRLLKGFIKIPNDQPIPYYLMPYGLSYIGQGGACERRDSQARSRHPPSPEQHALSNPGIHRSSMLRRLAKEEALTLPSLKVALVWGGSWRILGLFWRLCVLWLVASESH